MTRLVIALDVSLLRVNSMELIRDGGDLKDVKSQVRESVENAVL